MITKPNHRVLTFLTSGREVFIRLIRKEGETAVKERTPS